MNKITLHKAKGGKSFVGIKFFGNNVDVYYPEAYRWEDEEVNKHDTFEIKSEKIKDYARSIMDILRSISLTKTYSRETSKQFDNSVSESDFALKSYMWIIRDFIRNGYYKNREPVFKTNQNGRVDWKRTIDGEAIVSGKNIIYKDFVVSTKSNIDNIIVEIYRFCVRKSVFLAGWLLNLDAKQLGKITQEETELSDARYKRYVYALKTEIAHTFDDEKRVRLYNMLNVVTGLNKSNNGTLVYGVTEYDRVFERMIDRVYGNVDSTKYHPKGVWHRDGKNVESSSLEIDSILLDNNKCKCVVIDAKCYRYAFEGRVDKNTKGLPSTESIQKQLTYGDYISSQIDVSEDKLYNCFVLPYISDSETKLEYANIFAEGNWRKSRNTSWDKIYVIFVDLRHLIESWTTQNHQGDHDELLGLFDVIIQENNNTN